MELERGDSVEDLQNELDLLNQEMPLTEREAETRFMLWYDDICNERMVMLQVQENHINKIKELETAEDGYRTRIKELEDSTVVLVKTFEEAQKEIKDLRDKYEPTAGNSTYLESYLTVARERDKLRKSDIENKKRIIRLEKEIREMTGYIQDVMTLDDGNTVEQENRNQIERLVAATSNERTDALEKENAKLKCNVERLKRGNKSYVSRMKLSETVTNTENYISRKNDKSIKSSDTKVVINRKCIRTFLPKIDTNKSSLVSGAGRSKAVIPYLHSSSQTPTLRFGLGYYDIYRLRSKVNESASLPSDRWDCVTKYI